MGSFVQERAGELLTEPLFSRICKEIDNEVAVMEKDIRLYLSIIAGTEYCRDGRMPVHYEWRASNCQFDFSGSLHPKGRISPRITLGEFLAEEYTGDRKASYISGCGWNYPTYGDDLSYFTLAVGEQIMEQVLCRYVNFCTLSREEQYELRDEIHDIFYDNTLINEFFWAESLFEPELGSWTRTCR